MSDNVPPVSIDPLFEANLKDRLQTHIQYMNDLKIRNENPGFQMHRLGKLIAYGLPTIAVGVMIIIALPTILQPTPETLDTIPTAASMTETETMISDDSATIQDTDISTSSLVIPDMPSRPKPRAVSTEMIEYIDIQVQTNEQQALTKHRESLPQPAMIEMTQDIYNPEDMDALIEDTKKHQSYVQQYKTGGLEMMYTVYYKPDYHLMGTLHTCDTSYIISTPLTQETTRAVVDAYQIDSTIIIPITLLLR